MMRCWGKGVHAATGFVALLALLVVASSLVSAVETVSLQVEPTVKVKDVQRFGVNLGTWTSWGAEQLAANVLKNPGFEGISDRAIVIVKSVGGRRFTDDASWLARPDGFWIGAHYDIRTGPAAGSTGRIIDSRRAGRGGLPEFITEDEIPALTPGDIVALTRQFDSQLPTQWWIADDSRGQVTTIRGQTRPGSSGVRALLLTAVPKRPAQITSHMDMIAERAGIMLSVTGPWRLSFWARLDGGAPTLTVVFRRHGAPPFFSQTLTPAREWRQYEFSFPTTDTNAPAALELSFRTSEEPGRILLDDVELGAVQTPTGQTPVSAFRADVVETLQRLRPGYLRDWQGQLGDTLENRLAEPFARRASRYRPDGLVGVDYGYSLPEFLDLCVRAGARPWIIVPTAFSDDELVGLGRFLRQRAAADHFAEIVLEFGNENWNALFRPGGIAIPRLHGEVADRAFRKIREGAGPNTPLRMVVNGQHANPPYALDFATLTPSADALAVAPYILSSLQAGLSPTAQLAALFAGDEGRLRTIAQGLQAAHKDLAIAEVNLHTLGGSAPPQERDHIIAGAASGSALAKTLLDALALGARRQCVYVLAGYDTNLQEISGSTKLWGIVRDLGATRRLRPTGLALEMLNQAVAGDLYNLHTSDSRAMASLSVGVFRSEQGWSAALVSAAPFSRTVSLNFPASFPGQLPRRLLRLDTSDPEATNETHEDVRVLEETVTPQGITVTVSLPAWGFVVLLPSENPA